MRQSLKTWAVVAAAASGALGAGGGVAYADAGAGGGTAHSPGVLSGNTLQVTVDTPVNACGNSADAGAALNPAMGASCGNGAALAAARRPGADAPPPVSYRQGPGPAPKHAAPAPRRVRTPARTPDRTAPRHAHGPAAESGTVPAPRPVRDARAGAEKRAGTPAAPALLASTGPGELALLAGAGGGLLVGGALLLRRSGTRRR
ncbi:chaplin [Streptomyces angustmyceticus]|uniref:chaplin n=1 Tax=Streptomyces angustmyceticus TaxID=285578 RepID=UPI00344C28AC